MYLSVSRADKRRALANSIRRQFVYRLSASQIPKPPLRVVLKLTDPVTGKDEKISWTYSTLQIFII